jgi:carboxyl-terminal processing protease
LGSLLIFGGLYSFAFQQGRDSFLEQQTLIQDDRYPTNTSVAKNIKIDANLFGEVLKTLASRFYGKDTLDGEKLMEGAIKGMVDSLEDPFSEFLNAKDMAELDKELSGSFEGIGAEVGKKDGRIVIIAPLANTPAQRAGIQPQDEIVQINGASTYNMTTNDVVMKIRGKKGTPVKLLIMRKSFSQPKEFVIIRDTINIPSASVEMLPSGVALLKIYNFYQPLSVQFARSLKTIQDNNAKGVIIDLRNNPGGYLDIYTEIGNYFFNKGSLLLIEDYKGFVAKKEYTSKRDGELKDMPIIILINGGTASASEILAGSLRDNRGIKLVGENSFGKGSVQELISLSGNNQLKLTIAH